MATLITTDEERNEQDLQHFMVKAREAAQKGPVTNGRSRHRRGPAWALAIVLAVLVLIAAAAVGWLMFGPSSAGVRPVAYSLVKQAGQDIVRAIDSGVARFLSDGAATQPPAPEPPEVASATHPTRAAISGTRTPEVVAATAIDPILPSTVLPAPAILELSPDVLESMARPDPDPGPLYNASDSDVAPPVPLQPLVGRVIAAGVPRPGDMDVIVGRNGTVERVMLLVPNRFHERMLVAAVKNQQFRPALVHGRTVRYLVRIRVAS